MASTAYGRHMSAATPYTVSVGRMTSPPASMTATASGTARRSVAEIQSGMGFHLHNPIQPREVAQQSHRRAGERRAAQLHDARPLVEADLQGEQAAGFETRRGLL